MEEPTTIDRRSLCEKDMQCELEVQGSTGEHPRQIIMCEVQRVELDLGSTATMDDIACWIFWCYSTESWTLQVECWTRTTITKGVLNMQY